MVNGCLNAPAPQAERLTFVGTSFLDWAKSYLARRRLAYEIEGVREHHVCGWAFRRDAPRRRLWIAIEVAGQTRGVARADLYRADVQRARLGHDGYCGFALPVDWAAPGADMVVREPRYTLSARRSRSRRAIDRTVGAEDLIFRLDDRRDRLSGWISSSSDPHRRIRLQVRSGARLVAEQTACLYRKDVAAHGDPFHGFSVLLPLDVGPVELREAGTERLLHRSGR